MARHIASDTETYDFVIVGSGAGGGPLAANLAEAGYDVVALEGGGDDAPPEDTVPAFHALASVQPDLSWRMFVDLDDDPQRAARNSTLVPGEGVFYPRAGPRSPRPARRRRLGPSSPGFFIVTRTYMVSEKASDVIIAAARSRTVARPPPTVTPQREPA